MTRSYRLKWFLWLAILVTIGLIVTVFVNYRISTNIVDTPAAPEDTRATLSINNFEHVAMKEGRKQLVLNAESAKLFSDQQMAVLTKLSATIFTNDQQPIVLTADSGRLDLSTKDMTASGGVIARHPQYALKTEHLKYIQESHMMRIDAPVEITGDFARFRADSATYDTETGTIIFEGHVEGWFSDMLK